MKDKFLPLIRRVRLAAPAIFFFAGFTWDALTLGRRVVAIDFWLLGGYEVVAALLLWRLAHTHHRTPAALPDPAKASFLAYWLPWLRANGPFLALQFLFGSLFSALFIFYFKSAGHIGALALSAGLGGLLVLNEFIGRHYRKRFTLNWALFGLTAMLFLNFSLPHALGSLNPWWFYLSTVAGAGIAHLLRHFSPSRPGGIWAVWALAGALVFAYRADIIPPVPLVKRDMLFGTAFERIDNRYTLVVEEIPWWRRWLPGQAIVHTEGSDRVYCLSAVFAPRGIGTGFVHRWEYLDAAGNWQLSHATRFTLSGGREGGFRGYSWKQNPTPGRWRVLLQTEDGRTLAREEFRVEPAAAEPERLVRREL